MPEPFTTERRSELRRFLDGVKRAGPNQEPNWCVHPGELLKEEIREREMTQALLARKLNCSEQDLSAIIRGHKKVTAHMAIKLEQVLEISAIFWLRLQAAHDLHQARKTHDLHQARKGPT